MKNLETIYIIVDKNDRPYKTHTASRHGGIIAVYRTEQSAQFKCDWLNKVWSWDEADPEDSQRLPMRVIPAGIFAKGVKNVVE
jgi:hypothetical protein